MDETVPTAPRIPVLVKIISILYLITGIFGVLGSIVILVLGLQYGFLSPFARYGTGGAIAVFVISVVAFLVSRGLRQGKNWARRIAIVISVISIIATFSNHGTVQRSDIIPLVVKILIIIYLLVNRQVQIAFKRS